MGQDFVKMQPLVRGGASDPASPLISVVTVVFNGKDFIEQTLNSVLGQDYPNIEYIVIDGGSTDGTVEIVKRYQSQLAYFSSAPDRGIYDAMNKGIAVATGAWVNFMNAGDIFFTADTVSNVVRQMNGAAIIVYGGVEIRYPNFSRIENPGSPSRLWRGMQFSHQSAFIELQYHKAHPYNISNPIAADLELMYGAYKNDVEFKNTGLVVSSVITGGVSEARRFGAIMSSSDAVCGRNFRPLIRIYFFAKALNSIIRSLAKSVLPKAIVKKIIMLK